VAGWDLNECRMKRLLINRGYWDAEDLAKLHGHSWIIVDNKPLAEPRDYPHRTEDVEVNLSALQVKETFHTGRDIAIHIKASVSPDIRSIFNNKVKGNSYVTQHTRCPSLGAIEVSAKNVEFLTENGKLRVNILDNDGKKYCLPVSCKYIRDIFEHMKDIETLNKSIMSANRVHLRIGLARPFLIQENHCYAMINGLFLY
jgi:hypothetical protein